MITSGDLRSDAYAEAIIFVFTSPVAKKSNDRPFRDMSKLSRNSKATTFLPVENNDDRLIGNIRISTVNVLSEGRSHTCFSFLLNVNAPVYFRISIKGWRICTSQRLETNHF